MLNPGQVAGQQVKLFGGTVADRFFIVERTVGRVPAVQTGGDGGDGAVVVVQRYVGHVHRG